MLISEYIAAFISTSNRDKRYLNTFSNLCRLLNEHSSSLLISDFSESETANFLQFLRGKSYRPNTIRQYYQKLCYILNRAAIEHKINAGYLNLTVRGESTPAVSLTMQEVTAIYELRDISKCASIVRDYFVIMCCTGLRISDVRKLTPANVTDTNIHIVTQKTKQHVVIPIHPYVKQILYKWGSKFPRCSTQQAFYKTLKRLCKFAGIVTLITIERVRGNSIEKKYCKKYELVTPHTGRRTFATNLYIASKESDIPLARIMLLTGHLTEQAFFKYIRIDKIENADIMAKQPFFN